MTANDREFFSRAVVFFAQTFVNRNENVIPLQRRMREVATPPIKDKFCET